MKEDLEGDMPQKAVIKATGPKREDSRHVLRGLAVISWLCRLHVIWLTRQAPDHLSLIPELATALWHSHRQCLG